MKAIRQARPGFFKMTVQEPDSSPTYHRRSRQHTLWDSLIVASVFLAAGIGVAGAIFWLFPPKVVEPAEFTDLVFDREPMNQALQAERIEALLERLQGFGSRFPTQPGAHQARDLVREHLHQIGAEMLELRTYSVVPISFERNLRLLDAPKDEAQRIELFPFHPNSYAPMNTPSNGLRGTLVTMTAEELRTRRDFRGVIAVIDAGDPDLDSDFQVGWQSYAQLGVEAVILTHRDGFSAINWMPAWIGMTSESPINFVRVAAYPEILDYLGREVELRVRTGFRRKPIDTVIGVVRAENPVEEAMILTSPYDAPGILPDLALGHLHSLHLAVNLQIFEGLAANRATLQRDVVFVSPGASALGADDFGYLTSLLPNLRSESLRPEPGVNPDSIPRNARFLDRIAKHEERLEILDETLAFTGANEDAFVEARTTRELLNSLRSRDAAFIREQAEYMLGEMALKASLPWREKRVAYERSRGSPEEPAALATMLEAKEHYDYYQSALGFSLLNLLRSKPDFVEATDYRQQVINRLLELREHHEEQRLLAEQSLAIIRFFQNYEMLAFCLAHPAPPSGELDATERVMLHDYMSIIEPKLQSMQNVLIQTAARLENPPEVVPLDPFPNSAARREMPANPLFKQNRVPAQKHFPIFHLFNTGRAITYRSVPTPVKPDIFPGIEGMEATLELIGEYMLSLGHGASQFEQARDRHWSDRTYAGRVLLSDVGESIVPNFPLKNAVVGPRGRFFANDFALVPGFRQFNFTTTDPYGRFRVEDWTANFPNWQLVFTHGFNILAFAYDENDHIAFIKDEGPDGQRVFNSINISMGDDNSLRNLTLVTFPASPVTLIDLVNPQSLRSFRGVQPRRADTLAAFNRIIEFPRPGIYTAFLEPHQRAYFLLQAGAAGNELMQTTRAFLLNTEGEDASLHTDREIDGPGYLVADHPLIRQSAHGAAHAMHRINDRRITLQNRYGMADPLLNEFHESARQHLELSEYEDHAVWDRLLSARESLIYSILNYPVLRGNISEAVLGIVWYLALLVPFVFFFEKLLFCHSDVRRQLAAQCVIFLCIFTALNLLHPAFQMVRSSLMILLGFIIVLISSGITLLFVGRFQENLEDLKRRRGKVTAADVNVFGVMGTAFMLGLNNMHRRKIRTGLTCGTLVLLTFVIISFTGITQSYVDERVSIGRAPYDGVLLRKDMFELISPEELSSVRSRFASQYSISSRRIYTGRRSWQDGTASNPEFRVTHHDGERERRFDFQSILKFDHVEPLRHSLPFISLRRWFTEEDMVPETGRIFPIMISDAAAERLGFHPDEILERDVLISLGGQPFLVTGIFDSAALNRLTDLDGRDLLPFDIESVTSLLNVPGRGGYLVDDNSPRIPAELVMIAPNTTIGIEAEHGMGRINSVGISLEGVPWSEANALITTYLEQTGQPAFFGLDGVAYRGERSRRAAATGLGELLVPLLLAGLTVLNTMKGSVYERRDEIYVYNSVGIAPRYVFFMFMAEAMVYAVVGCVLGYVLSQGTGRVLTMLDLTGGLNMTFTSAMTIYASFAIFGAVIFSTWFPARTAMRIASPAEESGWRLPEPVDGQLRFDMPFNFRHRGRLAVVEFVHRYLEDHGEGGSGRFSASTPQISLGDTEESWNEPVPRIQSTIWLKPFDLGVSQLLTIEMVPDKETGLYKAAVCLDCLSGTREAWLHLNKGFVRVLRRHFLHWRALTEDQKEKLFQEAGERLTAEAEKQKTALASS